MVKERIYFDLNEILIKVKILLFFLFSVEGYFTPFMSRTIIITSSQRIHTNKYH